MSNNVKNNAAGVVDDDDNSTTDNLSSALEILRVIENGIKSSEASLLKSTDALAVLNENPDYLAAFWGFKNVADVSANCECPDFVLDVKNIFSWFGLNKKYDLVIDEDDGHSFNLSKRRKPLTALKWREEQIKLVKEILVQVVTNL